MSLIAITEIARLNGNKNETFRKYSHSQITITQCGMEILTVQL